MASTTIETVDRLALLPETRAGSDPGGVSIGDDRVELTNSEFAARVLAAAEALNQRGVAQGDVVAVILPNRIELIIIMFAAWRIGAAMTPVNPALTAGEIKYQIEDAGARVVIAEKATVEQLDCEAVDVADLPTTPTVARPAIDPDPSALALLIYTSGTTGNPKGVMLDHGNLAAMVGMITDALDLGESDRSLLILPLFHVNGIVVSVLSPLAVGGTTVLTGRFSAGTFFETVASVRPTYFSAVPTIYAMLANLPDEQPHDISSVRVAICGAAPMPAELITRFEDRYGISIVEGYGLSEGTCASTLNPAGQAKPGTVGKPIPGQEVFLRDNDGNISTEGRGEVVVRGPNVMRGYLNRPEETSAVLEDGWLRTGDIGEFDADGYLLLVDRVKDMIIRGGENIYPKEIESVLHGHPDVVEAAVVGRPHEVFGEEPVAFVSVQAGSKVTADELIAHCQGSLAKFKSPRDVFILDELPKNAIGKISKVPLRQQLTPGG